MLIFSIFNNLLFSCTADEGSAPDTEVETQVEQPKDEDTTPELEYVDPCIEDEAAQGMRFTGTVVFSDGTFADSTNTRIHMCSGGCAIAQWGEGGFCYPEGMLEENLYSLKIVPFGMEEHATVLGLQAVGQEDINLEVPIFVPEFTHFQDVEDGTFDAGDGLFINVEVNGYDFDWDPSGQIASVAVDPFEAGLPLNGIEPEQIVGMWYLGTFDAVVSPLWTFEFHNAELPAGTTLKILTGSYSDRKWVDNGTATVGEDGVVRVDGDSGISILSTLLLIKD